MSSEMIVRAWKDPEFRSQMESDTLPASPAGNSELAAADLQGEAYITSPACTIGPRCEL